jgi:hypothetical protein
VVDVACTYEKLASAAQRKVDKYKEAVDAVKQLTGASRCELYGFVVSPRGGWAPGNDRVLTAIGAPMHLQKSIIESVLYNSLNIHKDFMRTH